MVSHGKKLYNNLVQMAMLASLLRFQPELGGVHEPPLEADLILGQSWAHTSARTVHAHLEHAAHHKNIDNVIERYQEELLGADTGDDFIQSDVDMSDETGSGELSGSRSHAAGTRLMQSALFSADRTSVTDAEAIEVLLRQDMVLGASRPPSAPPSLEDGSAGSCCSPEPLDDDDDALVPLKPAQEYVAGDWPALEAEQEEEEQREREQRWRTVDDWEGEEEDEDGATEEEHRAALRHLWQTIDSTADPETGELFSRSEEGEEEGDGSASLSADRRPASEISDVPEKVRHVSGDDSGQGSSAESEEPGDAELALLDEMIETVRRRPELVQVSSADRAASGSGPDTARQTSQPATDRPPDQTAGDRPTGMTGWGGPDPKMVAVPGSKRTS
ncbi:hypothetical protein FJT64_027162 [Amphibalanus amphitrite]|uniref:Uncharacterized protein n=1 Tax=Amphibalanus amphitrite TaxID=1232801 RepID=A0A6A4VWF7_AMPAM|nr:hypothetical protein FJT64_027162 [Amphibalanus amphitrite]